MSFYSRAFLNLYSLAWQAARPLLRRHSRLSGDFEQRLAAEGWPHFPPASGPCIWLQAASGGEAWLIQTLVAGLLALPDPPLPLCLLCTTFTSQGLEILKKLAADPALPPDLILLPRYLPLDDPALMRRAMRAARPAAIALLETELWPGIMTAATREGIPLLILNARMTPKSLKGYSLLKPFWRENPPSAVLAVSPEDAERFARLFGPQSVTLMSNLKFDRAASFSPPADPPRNVPPTVAMVSVRQEEEGLLLPAVRSLPAFSFQGAPPRLIIAPRHMHRIPAWKKILASEGLPFSLRSSGPDTAAVLLWDTFGDLRLLYSLADSVFVGGSLAPMGGQNFLESLEAGVIPCVGPHTANFHWVGREIFSSGLATLLPTAGDLAPALVERLRSIAAIAPAWQEARLAARMEIRTRFQAWLSPHTGGGLQAARLLARHASGQSKRNKSAFP
ncbi:MAG: 3-deoxy-D-manno-octulosonic acid transferase [Desulfovibrio sp.]|jgi:3-deoxy-D-manno-octulosonic-acid transferase|nr:3-deoxy-D-manno-octulosonic acid transferase [Desulfovibrio sp.]